MATSSIAPSSRVTVPDRRGFLLLRLFGCVALRAFAVPRGDYFLQGDGPPSVVKFVPKAEGAQREMLFVNLEGAVNVTPIMDDGEMDDYWMLVMPRAEKSLREHLIEAGGPLSVLDALPILNDVADALVSLGNEQVVHRDLKPENVLLLDGKWCLADFGIARYAEATTAPDTWKHAMSVRYAAPERWRGERATSTTDVYALGVMAYEMVGGVLPFPGPSREDFREQHLHETPPPLSDVPPSVASLIGECLIKAPEARPTPVRLKSSLDGIPGRPTRGGLEALAEANRSAVAKRSERERTESEKRTRAERRTRLADAGMASFQTLSNALASALTLAAPSAQINRSSDGAWRITLLEARLTLFQPSTFANGKLKYGNEVAALDVVVSSALAVQYIGESMSGYRGRSHSLWYCDAHQEGDYGWFEAAFMANPMPGVGPGGAGGEPFALDPGEEAAIALLPVVGMTQLAWPFTRLETGNMDEFIERWADWLGLASQGRLSRPTRMPEQDGVEESFRR